MAHACRYRPESLEMTEDDRGRRTYSVLFEFLLDENVQSAPVSAGYVLTQARSASPNAVPARWQRYSFQSDTDPFSYALGFRVSMNPAKRSQFLISVTWAPLPDGVSAAGLSNPGPGVQPLAFASDNPLIRPPRIWWESESFSQVVVTDIAGQTIQNFARQPYLQQPIEQEATRGMLCAEWNVATLLEVIHLNRTYENHVNSTVWSDLLGIPGNNDDVPPRVALCRYMRGGQLITETESTPSSYYPVLAKFVFREQDSPGNGINGAKTWDRCIPEIGYRALFVNSELEPDLQADPSKPDDPNARIYSYTDIEAEPRPLDPSGAWLDPRTEWNDLSSEFDPPNSEGDPIKHYWRTFPEADFNNIFSGHKEDGVVIWS